jgi:DNA (cytosine-5)-methyltransferase 1
MNILSLFANIGVAEAYLEEIGCHVAVANELVKRRADLYRRIYPQTEMICGDITNADIFKSIIKTSQKANVNVIIAPPLVKA